jgi:hypothetical protein
MNVNQRTRPVQKSMTIEQIRQLKWHGNHASDSRTFFVVDAFVLDEENSLEDRMEALNIASSSGMGVESRVTPEEFDIYVKEARGY